MSPSKAIRAAIVLVALMTAACEPQNDHPLSGRLLFGLGEYLGEFDLATGESAILAGLGDVSITDVRPSREGMLLVSVLKHERDASMPLILQVDPANFQRDVLLSGRAAISIPGADTVVYDNGSALVATSLWRRSRDYRELTSLAGKSVAGAAVTADGTLFVEVADATTSTIYSYRVEPEPEFEALDALSNVCTLEHGAVATDSILCALKDDADDRFARVTPEGQVLETLSLPFDGPAQAAAWCPHNNVVVFSERTRSRLGGRPRTALWAYDLADGTSRQLSASQPLGNSVVCLER